MASTLTPFDETIAGMAWITPALTVLLLLFVLIIEALDWEGRRELLERNHPIIWKALNNRPVRLTLLLLMLPLTLRDIQEHYRESELAVAPMDVKMASIPVPSRSDYATH